MNLVSTGAPKKAMKGFTLIELLVVIAIIGILSAVVLASLSTARSKGQDAKVQEQLSSMRAAAEIYYGSHSNSYGATGNCAAASNLFTDTNSGMAGLVTASAAGGALSCNSNNSTWAVAAPLISDSTKSWCADSTGQSRLENGNVTASITSGACANL
ncbi:MAG TPA: type II secretion system protein [Candidatus Paceibacterota bacterium]|nr:type II secretion system protein [Candidatus Paceibacterota bacterium]